MWKATSDQVDNPAFKAFSRTTTNRLIFREKAEAPVQRAAEFWKPGVPNEPGGVFPGGPADSTITIMINFDHELQDRSGKRNHGIAEFTNDQWIINDGLNTGLSFAIVFNPNSNDTFDKLWIPFSPTTQILYDTPTGFSIFTRIMPYVITPIGQTASPTPLSNRVKYLGGAVRNLHPAEMHVIWWGSDYNSGTPQSRRQQIQTDLEAVKNTDYWKGLWEYSNCKPVGSITHVVNTTESIPSGNSITFDEIINCIKDSRDQGQVPDWNDFEEFSSLAPTQNWDYRHIYSVILPWGKQMPPGYGGATSVTNDGTGQTLFNWCAIYGPQDGLYGTLPDRTQVQTVEQGLMHEWIHAMVTPGVGNCTDNRANAAWLFDEPGFCNNIQHGPPESGCSGEHLGGECKCGNRLKIMTGTNALVESYWSNMAGRCVCPGVDSFWVRQPTNTQTGPIIRRYIFQKMDDLDNGATAAIDENGVVYFNVKKAGIEYKIKSAAAAVVVNQWADIWFTFNSSTNIAAMWINNTLQNQPSTEALSWNNTHSHFILANRNLGQSLGQFRGRMDDFRLYRNGVVSTTEVQNFDNNGLTVTGIEASETEGVFVVNRVKIDSELQNTGVYVPGDVEAADVPAVISSFTSTSFTATSFTL